MENKQTNKRKIINDPVHGFVSIPSDLIFDLIEHPIFQRLRRIKQLGLTHYVYPGATHTRFQHTIGALHLMNLALDSLKGKGVVIEPEEEEAVLIAILLHDIGHGPFSHALEESLIEGINHEHLSQLLMQELNRHFKRKLDLAIAIFNNKHSKKFLHQLVTSQLDMDRLDYIKRDSFYTGVTEGTIGTDRIIKMLNVIKDQLVVEKKGIYSVEKFLISRRLMYWQVYFHKTVVASENLLVKMLQRAKAVAKQGIKLYATPPLKYFLYQNINSANLKDFLPTVIKEFIRLDDSDIIVSAKEWIHSDDKVLRMLSRNTIERKLPKVWISEQPHSKEIISEIKNTIQVLFQLNSHDAEYFISEGIISNSAFSGSEDMIQIMMNESKTKDISDVSDILNVPYLQQSETKYFLCFPKEYIV